MHSIDFPSGHPRTVAPRAGRQPRVEDWRCWRDASHSPIVAHPELGWPSCGECRAAPAYYERPDYLPAGFRLNLYVPAPGRTADELGYGIAQIRTGSAIVGIPDNPTVYYEGFIFGGQRFENPRAQWQEAVMVAGGRLTADYPTTAMTRASKPGSLVTIGTWTPCQGRAGFDVSDEAALDAWLAVADGPDRGESP